MPFFLSFFTSSYDHHACSTGYVPSIEMHTQITAPPPMESSSQSTLATLISLTLSTLEGYTVLHVHALHSFEFTEPNALGFEKGDVIKVMNQEYKDWWQGQIRGCMGNFPTNYVLHASLEKCLCSNVFSPSLKVSDTVVKPYNATLSIH
jgi:SH3 domain-containing protein